MSLRDDVYVCQVLRPDPKGGRPRRHPAGRFVVRGGQVKHLEDYHQMVSRLVPEGPLSKAGELAVRNPGPDLTIASLRDVASGRRLDFVPEHRFEKPLPAPKEGDGTSLGGTFFYHRAGHDRPHLLEARQNALALDGSELTSEEASAVLENLRSGAAELRSARPEALTKAEGDPKDWTPESALAHLEGQVQDEHSKDAASALRRYLFEDPMNPGVGNKYAYQQQRAKGTPGAWASLDLNDFKHVNDRYGHDVGDSLIRAVGAAFRAAADPQKVKLFRPGGDEYAVYAQNPEDAYATVRAMRGRLDELPPVMGEYRPSVSAGFGHDFAIADRALLEAKKGKYLPGGGRAHAPGEVPHLAYSLIPGSEGRMPLSEGVAPPTAEELAPPPLAASTVGASGTEGGLGQKPGQASPAPAQSQPKAAGAA